MGKSIKGKECGKGIFQRKDGWYMDRYVHVTNDSMLKAVSLFEESSPTATV